MASNPPQAAAAISPLAIATAFIKQYYMILSTTNSDIHKFYKGDSQISFAPSCNTPAISQSFSSLENVEEKFAWAANSRVDFANGSIDAQESVGGGILVVVTGEIFLEGKDEKKLFVQTFFLKDDGKRAPRKKYFVFNDVFRFLERETKMESPKVEEEKVTAVIEDKSIIEKEKEVIEKDEISSPKSITSQQMNGNMEASKAQVLTEPELETETEFEPDDDVVIVVEKTKGIADIEEEETKTASEHNQIQESNDNDAEVTSKTVEKVPQETKNNTSKKSQKSKPPGSWASLVAGSSSKNQNTTAETTQSPPSSKQSPKKEKDTNVSTNTTERPKRPPRPQEAEAESTPAQNSGTTSSRASGYGSKGSSSLYIKNVEEGITEADLKELFSEYPFKIVNVSFYPSRGYAFVDFADANAVNAIMKENRQTFHINGRAIEVEKKSSDRRRGGGGNTSNGSRGGSGNGGSGNQKINLKGQHQRSHSGRRLNGGGRKGRTGGGDKKRDSATNSGNNNNNNN